MEVRIGPPSKEKTPDGHLRWRRRGRVRPWQQRVPAYTYCCVPGCGRRLTKRTRDGYSVDALVEGRLVTAGSWICARRHPDVWLAAPCRSCGAALFARRGPFYHHGRLVHGTEYITREGDTMTWCPCCGEDLEERQ